MLRDSGAGNAILRKRSARGSEVRGQRRRGDGRRLVVALAVLAVPAPLVAQKPTTKPAPAVAAQAGRYAAADALTILEQIEGSMVYLDTLGTPAETAARKRMRVALTSAYRTLHNRMHDMGHGHTHTPVTDHSEHHG